LHACVLVYKRASCEFNNIFLRPYQMANSRRGSITVALGEELHDRVNRVAKARNQKAAEFVREVLDATTRKMQRAVDEIKKQEAIILKEYDKSK
jgi:hypothetical protein